MSRQTRRQVLRAVGSAGITLAGVGTVAGHGGGNAATNSHDKGSNSDDGNTNRIDAVKGATRRYKDPDVAVDDGYIPTNHCVPGMGYHYVNPSLIGDGEVHHTKPEILLYEEHEGERELVAVEYYVVADLVDEAPTVLGQKMNGPMDNHGDSDGQHYDLHAWVWKENPDGTFASFNPNVSCGDSHSE